jgi:lysophospholipase L1-like esterase
MFDLMSLSRRARRARKILRCALGALWLAAAMLALPPPAEAVVSSTQNTIQYTGNGTTKAFAYPDGFILTSDIQVRLFDTSANALVSPQPVLNGSGTYDYTVSGTFDTTNTGYYSSGTVTFNNAPLGNHRVTLTRAVTKTQPTQYLDNSKFPAATVTGSFDRNTLSVQDVAALETLAIHIPQDDLTPSSPLTLPPAATRANQALLFDASGNPIAGLPTPAGTPVSAAMQPVVQAATLAAGRAALGVTGYNLPNITVDFTCIGDAKVVHDGVMTSGSAAYSSATAAFTSADVGKLINVMGAGASGAMLSTTIATFASATSVTLTASASTTVSAAQTEWGTDNTTCLNNVENDSRQEFFTPAGGYMSSLSSIKKRYLGEGYLILSNGSNLEGTASAILTAKTFGLEGANTTQPSSFRSIVFVGDSIAYGQGVNENQTYVSLIQGMLNQRLTESAGSFLSGGQFTRRTLGGSTSTGTTGPLQKSLVMQVNATINFPVDFVDYYQIFCQRSTSAGSLQVYVDGTLDSTVNCNGAAQNDYSPGLTAFTLRAKSGSTVQLKAITAATELTGAAFINSVTLNAPTIWLQANPGYATANFTPAAVLASLFAQQFSNPQSYTLYIVHLGANDMVNNTGAAVPVANYENNLQTIVSTLLTDGAAVMLCVPLQPSFLLYPPLYATYGEYRKAVYRVARRNALKVIDLSELDLAGASLYQADGIHPSVAGHAVLASFIYERSGLAALVDIDNFGSQGLTLTSPFTNTGAPWGNASCSIERGGLITLAGAVNVNSAAAGSTVSTLPLNCRPVSKKGFTSAAVNGSTVGSALLTLDTSGNLVMFGTSITAGTIYLDGIIYSRYR